MILVIIEALAFNWVPVVPHSETFPSYDQPTAICLSIAWILVLLTG